MYHRNILRLLNMFECNDDESNHFRLKIVLHVIWIWNVKLHRTDAKLYIYSSCTHLSMKNGKRNSKVIKSLLRFCYCRCYGRHCCWCHRICFSFCFVEWYKNRFKWRSDFSVYLFYLLLVGWFFVHHYHHCRHLFFDCRCVNICSECSF